MEEEEQRKTHTLEVTSLHFGILGALKSPAEKNTILISVFEMEEVKK